MELQLYNALMEAGVSRETAEKVAVSLEQEVHSLFDHRLEDLAKKADIAEVRTEIASVRTEIADVRTEMKTEFGALRTALAEVKADLTKTLLYGLVAVTAIFSAIVKLF